MDPFHQLPPYWLAPQSSIRYLLPLYSLASLVMARALWGAGVPAVAAARRWLIAVIAVKLDVLRLPAPPLTFPPRQWESGFVMAYAPDPRLGQVAVEYRLGGNTLYLLCRGAACTAVTRNQ